MIERTSASSPVALARAVPYRPPLPRLLALLGLAAFLSLAGSLAACDKGADTPGGQEAEGGGEEAEGGAETIQDRLTVDAQQLQAMGLRYAKVEERALAPSLTFPAEIVPVPDRYATVGPRVAGRVVQIDVNVGDTVTVGQTLAVLESAEVGRAWADLGAARARASVARRAVARAKRLQADRIASQRAVEEAQGAHRVAAADVQAALTRLATFGVDPKAPRPEPPSRFILTSPLAGTVTSRELHLGQWVEPADTAVEVMDLSQVWVRADIYERDARLVREGMGVEVEVRGLPGAPRQGTIALVGRVLDERTRTLPVRVVLDNADGALRPGMFAVVRVQGVHDHAEERHLAIPWAAVQQVGQHPVVFVRQAPGVFTLRRVHVGERAGDLVEVINGLRAGEEVVGDGSFLLKSQLLRGSLGEDE